MEVKKNNNLKILVVVLVVLFIGIVCYICYDNFISNDEIDSSEEIAIDGATVDELHDSLISSSVYGLYFNENVNIDDISYERIMPYVLLKYMETNDITDLKYDLQCVIDSDIVKNNKNCSSSDKVEISEEEINSFISETFNITNTFKLTDTSSNDDLYTNTFGIGTKGFVYSVKDAKYYLGYFSTEEDNVKVYNKLINYEQDNDVIYFYDKVVVVDKYLGVYNCYLSMDLGKSIRSYDISSKLPTDFISALENDLDTYKTTFKKGSDDKYYWYSSEIIK